MNNIINTTFDEIYCILNLDSKERILNVSNVFKKYNINVKYIYTCIKPIYHNIKDSYPSISTYYYDDIYEHDNKIYNRVFDCALNHYNIIKTAYKRNLNNILIFEDDINFLVDKKLVNLIISKMPNDYDIIKFYNGFDEINYPQTTEDNIQYTKHFKYIDNKENEDYYSCIMVAYSRNGMKAYTDKIEQYGIQACDMYYGNFIAEQNINIYRLNSYFIYPSLKSVTLDPSY